MYCSAVFSFGSCWFLYWSLPLLVLRSFSKSKEMATDKVFFPNSKVLTSCSKNSPLKKTSWRTVITAVVLLKISICSMCSIGIQKCPLHFNWHACKVFKNFFLFYFILSDVWNFLFHQLNVFFWVNHWIFLLFLINVDVNFKRHNVCFHQLICIVWSYLARWSSLQWLDPDPTPSTLHVIYLNPSPPLDVNPTMPLGSCTLQWGATVFNWWRGLLFVFVNC